MLVGLGALESDGQLTELGREMAGLPMHPRLGRLVLDGERLGCLSEALFVAAAVQGEGVFVKGDKGEKWADFFGGRIRVEE